jgi:hypothetical protein
MTNLRQDSWTLGKDLNLGSSEYKAGMITTQPRHLVSYCNISINTEHVNITALTKIVDVEAILRFQ